MKILQVIPYFCFAGAETMCENLTYALRRMGDQVTVVSLYDEHTPIAKRMEAAGVKIRYLDKKPGLDLSMVGKLRKIILEEQPDVVHSHLNVVKYTALAAKLSGVKTCVHTVHNVADKEAEGILQKITNHFYFHRRWSTPVALSGLVQGTVEEFYHLDHHRVPVIFNGIDLSRCMPKEDYGAGETVTFLHVGRFNEQKNHFGLLRSFRLLLDERPNCRLQLIGDGELRQQTEDLARELGMEDKIVFLGLQDNVYPWLNKADVFLLPSSYEGMPMTLIEAMGTGLPIVATGVGGVPDMLTDGESALLVPCEEEAVFKACLRLARDENLRRRLGQNARRDSVKFSADHMAAEYRKIYQM